MSILNLMKERYSCRRYSDKEVKKEDLEKILEAGRVAPTSHNKQPQKIYILGSDEAKKNLMKDFKYDFKAPYYLIFAYDRNITWKNDLNNNAESGEIDISIVMTHMMLMAEELGLGVCWIGHFDLEKARINLNIPDSEKVVAALSLGYHREDDRPSKLHSIKRSNEEIIKFL